MNTINTGNQVGETLLPYRPSNRLPQGKDTPMPHGFTPGDYDVQCGRTGKQSYISTGNRRFRLLVQASLDSFERARTKLEKSLVVIYVVDTVRSQGGGFVKQKKKTGGWVDIGDQLARDKVGHTLRDFLKARQMRGVSATGGQPVSSTTSTGRPSQQSEGLTAETVMRASAAELVSMETTLLRTGGEHIAPQRILPVRKVGPTQALAKIAAKTGSKSDLITGQRHASKESNRQTVMKLEQVRTTDTEPWMSRKAPPVPDNLVAALSHDLENSSGGTGQVAVSRHNSNNNNDDDGDGGPIDPWKSVESPLSSPHGHVTATTTGLRNTGVATLSRGVSVETPPGWKPSDHGNNGVDNGASINRTDHSDDEEEDEVGSSPEQDSDDDFHTKRLLDSLATGYDQTLVQQQRGLDLAVAGAAGVPSDGGGKDLLSEGLDGQSPFGVKGHGGTEASGAQLKTDASGPDYLRPDGETKEEGDVEALEDDGFFKGLLVDLLC